MGREIIGEYSSPHHIYRAIKKISSVPRGDFQGDLLAMYHQHLRFWAMYKCMFPHMAPLPALWEPHWHEYWWKQYREEGEYVPFKKLPKHQRGELEDKLNQQKKEQKILHFTMRVYLLTHWEVYYMVFNKITQGQPWKTAVLWMTNVQHV